MSDTTTKGLSFEGYESSNGKFHAGFKSQFATHYDAAMALYRGGTEQTEFITRIYQAVKEDRKYAVPMPPVLAFWLHKMANSSMLPSRVEIDTSKIEAAFAKAGENLKFPKFKIDGGDFPVKFAMAGPRSKMAGSITVAHPEFGAGFYGTIRDGQFRPTRDCPSQITELVRDFAANPSGLAGSMGREIGACCFCSRELTTTESLAAGYGPVWAEHYGLPWG